MTLPELLTFQCPKCKSSIPIASARHAASEPQNVSFQLACPQPGCGWQGVQKLNPLSPSRE